MSRSSQALSCTEVHAFLKSTKDDVRADKGAVRSILDGPKERLGVTYCTIDGD